VVGTLHAQGAGILVHGVDEAVGQLAMVSPFSGRAG
jgi:hypothetical protein